MDLRVGFPEPWRVSSLPVISIAFASRIPIRHQTLIPLWFRVSSLSCRVLSRQMWHTISWTARRRAFNLRPTMIPIRRSSFEYGTLSLPLDLARNLTFSRGSGSIGARTQKFNALVHEILVSIAIKNQAPFNPLDSPPSQSKAELLNIT